MKKLLILAAVLLLSGCSTRMVDFTAISTKNVDLPRFEQAERVVGEDCVPVILFPLGVPSMKTAIDNAIEQAGPGYDALADGVVYALNQSFIFGRTCYQVKGTPIMTSRAAQ